VAGILSSFVLPGCGGEEESAPFKPTDTSQFDGMKDMMIKNVKSKNYKGVAPPKESKTAPAAEKAAPAEEKSN